MFDIAEQIERIGDSLASFIESTRFDLHDWRPETTDGKTGRTILELAGECVATNHLLANLLARKTTSASSPATPVTIKNAAEARLQLTESSRELADVVRLMPPEAFDQTFPHWRGPIKGTLLVTGAYRNMAYHAGQVNLYQILNGDPEFHVPNSWY